MTECSKIIPQSNEALLSSADGFTAFSFGGYNIRFRSPYSLERYVDVVKWDDGYLVVLAKYSHNDEPEEEYKRYPDVKIWSISKLLHYKPVIVKENIFHLKYMLQECRCFGKMTRDILK